MNDADRQEIATAIHRAVNMHGLKATALAVSLAFDRYVKERWMMADQEEAKRLVDAIRGVKWES